MTPEERAQWNNLIGIMPPDEFRLVIKALEVARREERERCAKIAEEIDCYGNLIEASRTIAVAIRKGEQP
jgi:hypothetical protein